MTVCFISPLSSDRVPSPRTPVFFQISRAVAPCAVSASVATRPDNRSGDPGQTYLQLGERGRGRALGEGVEIKVEIKATGLRRLVGGLGLKTGCRQLDAMWADRHAPGAVSDPVADSMAAGLAGGAAADVGTVWVAGGLVGRGVARSAAGRFSGKEKARRMAVGASARALGRLNPL